MKTVLCLICLLVLPAGLSAQEEKFKAVVREVREDLKDARKEKALTKAEMDQQRTTLRANVTRLKERIKKQNAALEADEKRLLSMREERLELQRNIQAHTGHMKELDAVLRDFARDFSGLAERSPYYAEDPKRLSTLKDFLNTEKILGIQDIQTLVGLAFEDMAASAQIIKRKGAIVDRQGREVESHIIRMGNLTAVYREKENVGYLNMSPASGRLLAAASPGWSIRRNLKSYFNGDADAVYMDISGGVAIKQLSRRTTLWEQVQSGGLLIWPILLVGLVAAILVLERLFFLGRVSQNTDKLMTHVTELVEKGDYKGAVKSTESQSGRPTGNVLKAGLEQQGQPRDIIESSLAEAILKETPRLERFLPALKVLAAIAPLLGLLGTVTGMINTFHVITVHGTGDPRLMAGGISEALITTQLGLAVAIPILVITALLGRKASRIASDMEEKAMALIAALLRDQRLPDGSA
ncbi:MAG: MotA [Deltaproteobacteria bacterium]|nr:MotA [Deltaproteobacteria bacterium]